MFSKEHIKSGRFNAGEKLMFWGGVFVLGLTVVASGLVMDQLVPGLIYERSTMQIAHMVHAVATVLMIAMFMGHIYLGTIGTEGTYEGMKTGYVDESWAKEHHELWLEDVKSGKIPRERADSTTSTAAFAKLPPLSEEAKAKAAEAAAKTAWSGKVDAYLSCKSQDNVAAQYYKTAKAAGKETKPPMAMPACADPGAFTYAAAEVPKIQEAAGAHSPPATAVSPPSGKLPAAAAPAVK